MSWSTWDYCIDCGECGFNHGDHYTEAKRRSESKKFWAGLK